jgi:hypothetical protein
MKLQPSNKNQQIRHLKASRKNSLRNGREERDTTVKENQKPANYEFCEDLPRRLPQGVATTEEVDY